MEYVVKSATGHPSTPKGGTPEYRNGPWYKAPHGKKQGDSMGAKKAYGYGSYATKKMRYITIEQKWSHLKRWYDEKVVWIPIGLQNQMVFKGEELR